MLFLKTKQWIDCDWPHQSHDLMLSEPCMLLKVGLKAEIPRKNQEVKISTVCGVSELQLQPLIDFCNQMLYMFIFNILLFFFGLLGSIPAEQF